MYYDDGSFAGINEIVFNFKPWLDWYLQTTGQRLVGGAGGADATSGASDSGHGGGSDATSGASDSSHSNETTADATSGASEH